MPMVQAGDIRLNYVEHGSGDNIILFIHGNLGCSHWMDLVWPLLDDDMHVYAVEWRGCGDSDKPAPRLDYSNYSMGQHASDMLKALDTLGIRNCHLATHSTGGIISAHMLLMAPERFGKVLALDPVSAKGLAMGEDVVAVFAAMKAQRDASFAALASAAPTLFLPKSLQPDATPELRPDISIGQRDTFNLIVDKTAVLSDGIWFGTPRVLTEEYHYGSLAKREGEILHRHLILWGEHDYWIPRAHIDDMARALPNCQLEVMEGVGHSCNLEAPERYVEYFHRFFREP